MNPDVSVIVPLYRGKKYLKQIVEQAEANSRVLQKQNMHIELIFVNDSPEDKIEICEGKSFPILLLENEKNRGVHFSRIRGYYAASGNYTLFLDQDDRLEENYLSSQLTRIGGKDAVVCNGTYRNGKKIFEEDPEVNAEWLMQNFKLIRSPGQVLLRHDAVPQFWLNNVIEISGADDLFLWSLMAIEKRKIVYNGESLFTHVENGANTSFLWKKQRESLEEVREKVKEYCPPELFPKWDAYVKESIAKFAQYTVIEEKWCNLEKKTDITEYLEKNQVVSLAVYGYGIIGKRLCKELQRLNVKVNYVCDKAEIPCEGEVEMVSHIEGCRPVDLMIVTPIFAYSQIATLLQKTAIKKVISVEQFLDQL